MNNEKNENLEEDFSLYTEKIVVNPLFKYKKLIELAKVLGILCISVIIVGIVLIYLNRYLDKKNVEEVTPRPGITIEKDEYSKYGKSPALDSEEPDLTRNSFRINNANEKAMQSVISIGDNSAGVVIGEVEQNYIILTEYNSEWNNEDYYVRKRDDFKISVEVLNKDKNSGIVIVAANKHALNDAGIYVKAAVIGNSYQARQHEIVVAEGRIQDNSDGYAAGFIKSMKMESDIDITYDILDISIEMKENDYFFLFNQYAELIGVSHYAESEETKENVIGISSVKTLIEYMSTAVPVTYLGVRCANITKDVADQFNFPEGIYISEVEIDSPAYKAGLQSGDIIFQYNDGLVSTIQELSDTILSGKAGDTVKIKVKRSGKGEYRELEYSAKLNTKQN